MYNKKIDDALYYYKNGNFYRAEQICKELLSIYLEQPKVLNLLGMCYLGLGSYDDATKLIKLAICYSPNYAKAYINLGIVSEFKNQIEDATNYYKYALIIEPNSSEACFRLAQIFLLQGYCWEALEKYCQALAIYPDWLICRQSFINSFNQIYLTKISSEILEEVAKSFLIREIDKQPLSRPAVLGLKQQKEIINLLNFTPKNDLDLLEIKLYQDDLISISHNALLRNVLEETIVTDIEFETVLTNCRCLCLMNLSKNLLYSLEFSFLCALALQCFNNEYIFKITSLEEKKISQLKVNLEIAIQEQLSIDNLHVIEGHLAIFGMYYPIHTLKNSDKLLEIKFSSWRKAVYKLFKKQLIEYQEEKEILKNIQILTNIDNSVSLAVKLQYEKNPYPRWFNLSRTNPEPINLLLKSHFFHFPTPDFLNQTCQVLVAGCGTGREAIFVAKNWQNVEVMAVDLSAKSLSYAIRMANKMLVNNISFYQGDILKLAHLNQKFAIVCCAGVLHHLKEPIEGWRSLVKLLQPFGMMRIGLYSSKARRHIQDLRDSLKINGFEATPQKIRLFREAVKSNANNFTVEQVFVLEDFYSLSSCRDLFFHVQECQFTLIELQEILHNLGLKFIGFELDNIHIKYLYKKDFPEDIYMTNLSFWDKFEDIYPDTFIEMYQFWCQKIE